MFNPNHQHHVEAHMREMQRDAEQRRLAHLVTNTAQSTRPVGQRLMTAVGQQLVETGRFLLSRGETEPIESNDWEYFGRVLS